MCDGDSGCLAYRQFLYPLGGQIGQTSTRQIDASAYARDEIVKACGVRGKFQNGYLFYTDDELKTINRALSGSVPLRKAIRNLICVGSHLNLGIHIEGQTYPYTVNHVYCSGLPISYTKTNPLLWKGIAELFLEAVYENTLLLAMENNKRSGFNQPCYLTLVGGEAFGMDVNQIYRAIERACILVARSGVTLDVRLVHYRKYNPALAKFGYKPKIFDGTEHFDRSIWDLNPDIWDQYVISGATQAMQVPQAMQVAQAVQKKQKKQVPQVMQVAQAVQKKQKKETGQLIPRCQCYKSVNEPTVQCPFKAKNRVSIVDDIVVANRRC